MSEKLPPYPTSSEDVEAINAWGSFIATQYLEKHRRGTHLKILSELIDEHSEIELSPSPEDSEKATIARMIVEAAHGVLATNGATLK